MERLIIFPILCISYFVLMFVLFVGTEQFIDFVSSNAKYPTALPLNSRKLSALIVSFTILFLFPVVGRIWFSERSSSNKISVDRVLYISVGFAYLFFGLGIYSAFIIFDTGYSLMPPTLPLLIAIFALFAAITMEVYRHRLAKKAETQRRLSNYGISIPVTVRNCRDICVWVKVDGILDANSENTEQYLPSNSEIESMIHLPKTDAIGVKWHEGEARWVEQSLRQNEIVNIDPSYFARFEDRLVLQFGVDAKWRASFGSKSIACVKLIIENSSSEPVWCWLPRIWDDEGVISQQMVLPQAEWETEVRMPNAEKIDLVWQLGEIPSYRNSSERKNVCMTVHSNNSNGVRQLRLRYRSDHVWQWFDEG